MDPDFFCAYCGAANPSRNVICSFCSHSLISTPYTYMHARKLLQQRYRVIQKVGQGGFATVYKAEDLQFSSALRAIKEMDDHLLSTQERQEAITAFQQEAHILARLMHPNLPRIYDYFEEQQHCYLVMDYIEGETLEAILARSPQGKLPVAKVIQYALQLCTVLNYLH